MHSGFTYFVLITAASVLLKILLSARSLILDGAPTVELGFRKVECFLLSLVHE
jgi:hypothetical protein